MCKYVVIDLEMCKVPRGMRSSYHKGSETIQIGAVLIDEKYQVVDKYMAYVKPEYGRMDSYIKNLTGITMEDLINAPVMKDAIKDFLDWIPDEEVEMVSWSMTDMYQLKHDLEIRNISDEKISRLIENWVDCQKIFDERLGFNNPSKLETALIITDTNADERCHDGLADAYNTAALFVKLFTEPELKLNDYYVSAKQGSADRLTYSLGDMMETLNYSVLTA